VCLDLFVQLSVITGVFQESRYRQRLNSCNTALKHGCSKKIHFNGRDMKKFIKLFGLSSFLLVSCLLLNANADSSVSPSVSLSVSLAERIDEQLKKPGGGRYDVDKAAGGKPALALKFFGIEPGMQVLDIVTGSGYSAEMLSAAVGASGLVYAHNPFLILRLIGGEHHKGMMNRVSEKRLPNVRYLVVEVDDMPFEGSMDMAFWGLNFHDEYNGRGETSALNVLANIKRALKPGGILAMTDHIGVPGQDNKALHRIEPEIMTALITKAGFEIEAASDLLANADDDHLQSIYTDGLRYRTDRIMIRARKP